MVKFRITAGTNVGCVRTNNEDNFIVNENLSQSDWFLPQDTSQVISLGGDGCVMVVADGMGGLNAGEVASSIAVETVKQCFLDADLSKVAKTPKSIEKFMRDIVVKADISIKKHVKESPETRGMGTTLIFAWIKDDVMHLVWCGDSRAYIYNEAKGLIRFSKDHSYVQQLVDEGKLDEDLAFDHPESNIITRCLGDFQDRAKPDYKTSRLQTGDFILLCSDGLCGLCRDEEILHIMQHTHTDIEQCKRALIHGALEAGGYDNVTVALMEVVSVELIAKEDEKKKKEKIQTLLRAVNTRITKEANENPLLGGQDIDPILPGEDNVTKSNLNPELEPMFAENSEKAPVVQTELEEDVSTNIEQGKNINGKLNRKGKWILCVVVLLILVVGVFYSSYKYNIDLKSLWESTVDMLFDTRK